MNLGRFDLDLGPHDGEIFWDLRPAGTGDDDTRSRILSNVAARPGELNKEGDRRPHG